MLETKPKFPELCMASLNDAVALIVQRWFRHPCRPAPDVAEPSLRQDMDGRFLGTAVMNRHPYEYVISVGLGILDLDIKVAIVIEEASIDQLELHCRRAAPRVLLDQPLVGVRCLRQLIERPCVRVARDGIEVVVELLDILAVVALAIGQAKQPLLEDRVAAV